MLWIDDPSSDEDGRRKRLISRSINQPIFPVDSIRMKQRSLRRQHHRKLNQSVNQSISQSTNQSDEHLAQQSTNQNADTLTSSASSCSIHQSFNRSMNQSISSIASSTCLSSASSTVRRLPRKHSINQSINRPHHGLLKHSRSALCLEARDAINVISSDDEEFNQSINQSINQSKDGSRCQLIDCLACSALSSCASPSSPNKVHYLSDPESSPFFDQSINQSINQKPLLFVPSAQSLVSMFNSSQLDASINQSVYSNQSINQSINQRSVPHVTIDIPNEHHPIIMATLQSPTNTSQRYQSINQLTSSQCYQSINQLMSPRDHIIEVSSVPLLSHSPVNTFVGMQFMASTSPIKTLHPSINQYQSINQLLSPRYQISLDLESCGTMVRAGCLCLMIGLVVLIASLYFLPLMEVSSIIHTLGFILPLFTILMALYACTCADRMGKTSHLNIWLTLGAFNLFGHLAFAYDCIVPAIFSSRPLIDLSTLRASFSLGTVVLVCAAVLGLVLGQVSHWKDTRQRDQPMIETRPIKSFKRPPIKPIKHSASLADLRTLLIERTRLRQQRRTYARENGQIRTKDEKSYEYESCPSAHSTTD